MSMKKLSTLIAVTIVSYVGIVHAGEPRTQKYFREHIEEARTIAKNCNITQEECKNARRAVWSYEHSGHLQKTAPKSEPVKK